MVYLTSHARPRLEQLCLASLQHSPYAAVRLLGCRVTDDTATLSGTVPTYYTKQVALLAVGGVPGISRVIDRIEVAFPDVSDRVHPRGR